MGPLVQRHGDRFTERNGFLHALLGLVVAGKALERIAGTGHEKAGGETPDDDSAEGADVFLHALLGAISAGRTFRAVIEREITAARRSDTRGERSATPTLEGLLR